MEWISFESLALVVLVIALGAHLVWAEIKAAGQRVQDITDRRLINHWKDELDKPDEAERRRMVYEADRYNDQCSSMEPFCGGSDAHTRSRAAVARAQEAARASMKL